VHHTNHSSVNFLKDLWVWLERDILWWGIRKPFISIVFATPRIVGIFFWSRNELYRILMTSSQTVV
jgi:hypothetical protein